MAAILLGTLVPVPVSVLRETARFRARDPGDALSLDWPPVRAQGLVPGRVHDA